MVFITATRKGRHLTVTEIEGYRLSRSQSNSGIYYSKSDFFREIFSPAERYLSYNPFTGTGATLERKISPNNEEYLQSIGNGTISDNLLHLPNC
jgi:hypothetical protein